VKFALKANLFIFARTAPKILQAIRYMYQQLSGQVMEHRAHCRRQQNKTPKLIEITQESEQLAYLLT
jgi:hypothetical protein